ncbi:MAG: [LysW]-aminoadipate kinase [Anaerolineae bacterium]|nr:[LysW]-aminoadipate kinase [Anaerolineae bacterium]MDW8102478.1 [LysW]-aminoadipate kinase [Anaerolineae bacterium]
MLVVKFGGNGDLNLEAFCSDVAFMVQNGHKVVVVHGGSREMDLISEKLGKPPLFVNTPSGFQCRYTDRETMEIFTMVLAGRVNKLLVEKLQKLGVNAIGLSGLDGGLIRGERKGVIIAQEGGKKKVLKGDYGGTVKAVNAELLLLLLERGYTPVIAPVALSDEGEALNVDGDRVAAAVAGALGAETLLILSGVPGLLSVFPDESTLITEIPAPKLGECIELYAQGRMKKKLLGAVEALNYGVPLVILADGRVEKPIRRALEGCGTFIRQGG